jgi:hypothetical protein
VANIELQDIFALSRIRADYCSRFFTLAIPGERRAPDIPLFGPIPEFDPAFQEEMRDLLSKSEHPFHGVLIGFGCSGEQHCEWVELVQTATETWLYRQTTIAAPIGTSEPRYTELVLSGLGRLGMAFRRRIESSPNPTPQDQVQMGGVGARLYCTIGGDFIDWSMNLVWPPIFGSKLNRWAWFLATASPLWIRVCSKFYR